MAQDRSKKVTWQAVLDELMPIIQMKSLSWAELLGSSIDEQEMMPRGRGAEWDLPTITASSPSPSLPPTPHDAESQGRGGK